MKTKDMTVGSPTKSILLFAVPIFLGSLFQQFYNLVDTLIVGRFLGEEALAAVGSTGSMSFFVIGFTAGLTQGFGVVISHAFGGKKWEELKHYVALSIFLTVVFSLLISIPTVLLSRPILILLNTPENIIHYASDYLRVLLSGIIFTMSYNVSASILRAVGDSKTPLYFLIFSAFLNIFLDLLFITVFQMGTAGAAYATVLSQGISAVLCFGYMFRSYEILRVRKKDFSIDLSNIIYMVRFGIPMALNFSVTAIGSMVLQSGVNQFGSAVVASYTACSKVDMLATQPMIALASSVSTFCGQNMGAEKYDRIFKAIRKCMVFELCLAAFGILLFSTCARFVIGLFIADPSPEVFEYGIQYLFTCMWFFPFLSFIFLFRSALVGLKNSVMPMVGGVLEMVSRYLCVKLLLKPLGFWSICLTNPITWVLTSILFAVAYFVWERKVKIKNAPIPIQ